MKKLYYLYAITDSPAPLPLLSGIGQNLEQVQLNHLFAIIDEVPEAEFNQEALSVNLHQTAWLTQKVQQHHQLIQQLQQSQESLIPIKFGSVFEQKENVQQLLTSKKIEFEQQIQYLNGKEEWSIKIYIDTEKSMQAFAQKDEELQMLQTQIQASTAGKAFFLKKKYDKRLQALTHNLQQHTADDWIEDFSQYALALKEKSLPSNDIPPSENHLLLKNLVALTPKTTAEQWISHLSTLERKYPSLEIALEGPWAAYHFVENSI